MASNSQLACHLCNKTANFDDGKILACHHWACVNCVNYFDRQQNRIYCPSCKQESFVHGSQIDDDLYVEVNRTSVNSGEAFAEFYLCKVL